MVDELLERLIKLLDRDLHDSRHDPKEEAASDHCPGSRQALREWRTLTEPVPDRILDGVRDGRVAYAALVETTAGGRHRNQFLNMQRDAVGSLVDGRHQFARWREVAAEDQSRHIGRLVHRQRLQAELLGEPLGQQARPPLAECRTAHFGGRSIGRHQQQGQFAAAPRKLSEDLEAELVGPLEVLKGQKRRRGRLVGDQVHDVKDDQATALAGRAPVGRRHVAQTLEQARPKLTEARPAGCRAREVEEQRPGDLQILRSKGATREAEAEHLGLAANGAGEAGLPDPRLPCQEQHAPALGRSPQLVLGERQEFVAANEDRAFEGPSAIHGSESTSPLPGVIGRMTNVATDIAANVAAISVTRFGPHRPDRR